MSTSQFGFLSGRCTVQQLLLFFHKIHESSNNGSQTEVIYLDFAKHLTVYSTMNYC